MLHSGIDVCTVALHLHCQILPSIHSLPPASCAPCLNLTSSFSVCVCACVRALVCVCGGRVSTRALLPAWRAPVCGACPSAPPLPSGQQVRHRGECAVGGEHEGQQGPEEDRWQQAAATHWHRQAGRCQRRWRAALGGLHTHPDGGRLRQGTGGKGGGEGGVGAREGTREGGSGR